MAGAMLRHMAAGEAGRAPALPLRLTAEHAKDVLLVQSLGAGELLGAG